ncbi:MAG: hypothetical protein JSR55_04705 [Proteobacteria bacterium]|nr:hypothetical protein [Pseudomonadota bacterium]
MRSIPRAAFLIAAFSAITFIAGCDSLPHIDLSGIFDGNHPATRPASLDVVQRDPDLTLRFHKMALKDSKVDPGSNEITLHFDGNADAAVIAGIQQSAPDWIAGTQTNGDTANIVARKDVEFSTAPSPDGFELTLTPRTASAAPIAAPTEPVEAIPLRGDQKEAAADGDVDGMQREDLRNAFGVDPQPGPAASGL